MDISYTFTDIKNLIDKYRQVSEQRLPGLQKFYKGEKPYLIIQKPVMKLFGSCNTPVMVVENNLSQLEEELNSKWSDDLFMAEPWIGTGVYANAFGCEYLWREDNAPDAHYRYYTIDDIKGIEYPDYNKSPVMNMVLETIDRLKEITEEEIPISVTDTQSPFDTATLILEASEFFTACYTHEEIALDFMEKITDLIIEFSKVQIERIGKNLAAQPGHLMPSIPKFRGLSISDDNLSVSSPQINKKIAFPSNQRIADAFDGLVVHSCGPWTHTMKMLPGMNNIMAVEGSIHSDNDPNPNDPADVHEALAGSGIIVKVRTSNRWQTAVEQIQELVSPDMQVIIQLPRDEDDDDRYQKTAEENYKRVREALDKIYET